MTRQVRKPRNINDTLSGELVSRVSILGIPVPPGVTMYVTDSNNGRFRVNSMTVTVPLWAYEHTHKKTKDDPRYAIYYIAHELAHAWVYVNGESRDRQGGDDSMHGKKFYKEFKRLCPPDLWHYELEYKPQDAKRAGISPNPKVNAIAALPDAPAAVRDTVDQMVTATYGHASTHETEGDLYESITGHRSQPIDNARRTYPPSMTDKQIRADAIKRDPRLKKRLAQVPDREVKSYVVGWFKKSSKV